MKNLLTFSFTFIFAVMIVSSGCKTKQVTNQRNIKNLKYQTNFLTLNNEANSESEITSIVSSRDNKFIYATGYFKGSITIPYRGRDLILESTDVSLFVFKFGKRLNKDSQFESELLSYQTIEHARGNSIAFSLANKVVVCGNLYRSSVEPNSGRPIKHQNNTDGLIIAYDENLEFKDFLTVNSNEPVSLRGIATNGFNIKAIGNVKGNYTIQTSEGFIDEVNFSSPGNYGIAINCQNSFYAPSAISFSMLPNDSLVSICKGGNFEEFYFTGYIQDHNAIRIKKENLDGTGSILIGAIKNDNWLEGGLAFGNDNSVPYHLKCIRNNLYLSAKYSGNMIVNDQRRSEIYNHTAPTSSSDGFMVKFEVKNNGWFSYTKSYYPLSVSAQQSPIESSNATAKGTDISKEEDIVIVVGDFNREVNVNNFSPTTPIPLRSVTESNQSSLVSVSSGLGRHQVDILDGAGTITSQTIALQENNVFIGGSFNNELIMPRRSETMSTSSKSLFLIILSYDYSE